MADTITDEYGYPFDSLNGDRKMSAASWRKMLGELFTVLNRNFSTLPNRKLY